MGLRPESCRVFHQKGYYSPERDDDIVVDVSIELSVRGLPRWSVLWAWECKDNTRPIDVSELEEFNSKLEQIGRKKVKGGLATTSGLRRGAERYAESQGIAVVVLRPLLPAGGLSEALSGPSAMRDTSDDVCSGDLAVDGDSFDWVLAKREIPEWRQLVADGRCDVIVSKQRAKSMADVLSSAEEKSAEPPRTMGGYAGEDF